MQEMLKYMHTIRMGSSRTGGLAFKQYDEQFRIKKARNPDIPWGLVDGELWLLYMYRTATFQGNPTVPLAREGYKKLKCFNFNYKGSCLRSSSCTFSHSCIKCNGNHGASTCHINDPVRQNQSMRGPNFRPQASGNRQPFRSAYPQQRHMGPRSFSN